MLLHIILGIGLVILIFVTIAYIAMVVTNDAGFRGPLYDIKILSPELSLSASGVVGGSYYNTAKMSFILSYSENSGSGLRHIQILKTSNDNWFQWSQFSNGKTDESHTHLQNSTVMKKLVFKHLGEDKLFELFPHIDKV